MASSNGSKGAFIALSRFGFGARPGDLAAVSVDPLNALRQEILLRRVALPSGPDLIGSTAAIQMLDEFRAARTVAREKADQQAQAQAQAQMAALAPQAIAPPVQGFARLDLAKPDMIKPDLPKGEAAVMQPRQQASIPPRPEPPQNRIFRAETLVRVQAAAEAPVGLGERLVWFWSNHFCISLRKGGATGVCAGSYEREVIRPHVFGKFGDMLLAAESHPAMLNYLDNRQSIGPNSKAGMRRDRGLNENLAREIMELHTLGVDAGYSQTDVTTLAKILTGWTIVGRNDDDGELGEFLFAKNRHEPGPETLLGKTIPEGGMEQGKAALLMIASHPATARHIAQKLVRHFISDDPSPALIARLAKVFQDSEGDLSKVTLALVESEEAWDPELQKIRSPQEFLLAALRLTGVRYDIGQVNGPLRAMGHSFWAPDGPNGYADTVAAWASPEGMKMRLDFASALAHRAPEGLNPNELLEVAMGEMASKETRQAVMRAESREQVLALLIMAPEFQRR